MASSLEKDQSASTSDEVDLGRLFGLLLDHKWLIAAITAAFTALGIIYGAMQTPIYQANALMEIEERSSSSNPVQNIGIFGQSTSRSPAEIQILQSRMVLGKAVDRENLQMVVKPKRFPVIGAMLARRGFERPGFAQGWSSVWANENVNVTRFVIPREWVGRPLTLRVTGPDSYALLDGGSTVLEGQVGELAQSRNGNVELRVMDINAGRGAEFTLMKRSSLSAINGLRGRFEVEEAGQSSTGILNLTLKGAEPQQVEDSLKAISEVYVTQNIERQSAETQQSLDFLKKQIPEIREQLSNAENELNNYRVSQDSVDLNQETQSVLNRLVNVEGQLNQLSFNEADLSQRFTKNHPEYKSLLEKKQQLQNEKAQLQKQVNNLPETQQKVLRLQRNVNVTQDIYTQLLNRMQELNIAKAGAIGNVRIIDDAVVEPWPVAPRKTLITFLFMVVGFILSVVFVLVRGAMKQGVESSDQIENIGLPVYASVPLSSGQNRLTRSLGMLKRGKRGSSSVDRGVLAINDTMDPSVEAVRSLRTSLQFAMMEAPDSRLMITGPSPGVGKSFITANLGVVCAQAGQRVLMIDADMRKGHLHQMFDGKSSSGLSDILLRKDGPENIIRQTSVENLDYVARGTVPPNPAELLMNARFGEFLEWADRHYDLVIMDTPPILAVTDAAIVGKQAGTSLMVARYGVNPPRELEHVMRRFQTSGVEIKGCILNAIEQHAASRYSNYYYAYR
ncbi:tyrosine-protein kinase Etk/Wzc [Kushneria sinocarnis]|uniref:Tyrosine-protein kinase Etk/Wzc n=1 Tax=Kushneria sinocarnis TaxID=595502 RepID=A0A420WXU5_9GAMM|nr:polysaccharide biosynthesis tyrosine autokinase [Kushneria sinocarnis]RKR06047.1 tyrosine-protein kinase Etk/Wzc [Kushneria sinocarnis]